MLVAGSQDDGRPKSSTYSVCDDLDADKKDATHKKIPYPSKGNGHLSNADDELTNWDEINQTNQIDGKCKKESHISLDKTSKYRVLSRYYCTNYNCLEHAIEEPGAVSRVGKIGGPYLKSLSAVFPEPTNRPWVSEDGMNGVCSKHP